MLKLIKKFIQTVLPRVIKPLHVLWNEMIGFLFLAFAVFLIRPVWRGYRELDGDPVNLIKLLLSIFFLAVMLGFGLHAFWKARRIARS